MDKLITKSNLELVLDAVQYKLSSVPRPTEKLDDMTQPVGVDSEGKLWTAKSKNEKIFSSYEDAVQYATTDSTAYIGQQIVVVDEVEGTASLYIISNSDMELSSIKGDDGSVHFETDNTLKFENGVLSVNTTNDMEQDNTLPITSAAVFATVGNIESLLKTI